MSVLGDLSGLARPEPWTEEALCAQTDPQAFFVDRGESAMPAKRVCAECPVREICLQKALDSDERFGVWGGFSEVERKRMRRGEIVEFKVGRKEAVRPQVCGFCHERFAGHSNALYCCVEHRRAAQLQRHNARRRGEAA